MIFGAVDINVS